MAVSIAINFGHIPFSIMTQSKQELVKNRAASALRAAFVADALAMPVHWYYRAGDIIRQFPEGLNAFFDAPAKHPSSIMSLHSTSQGGRSTAQRSRLPEIVGDVILKGKRQYWDVANMHYHQGMKAGENTLNAHCARLLMRTLADTGRRYDPDAFLDAYIDMMTAEPARHPDTYAESYHRGFFANWAAGKPADQCAAVTHDTASIGGLVTLAPLIIAERLAGVDIETVAEHCKLHLSLTHPGDELATVAVHYAYLLDTLLHHGDRDPGLVIEEFARKGIGLNLQALLQKNLGDNEVVGGLFSPACYISGAWPSVLYFARKYVDRPSKALQANAEAGGDNVHRGFILATLLGAIQPEWNWLFDRLVDATAIDSEIKSLIAF
ncbi:ADP-ribosylglycohydrolase family protein [Aurantivibrio plasticivorans]